MIFPQFLAGSVSGKMKISILAEFASPKTKSILHCALLQLIHKLSLVTRGNSNRK